MSLGNNKMIRTNLMKQIEIKEGTDPNPFLTFFRDMVKYCISLVILIIGESEINMDKNKSHIRTLSTS